MQQNNIESTKEEFYFQWHITDRCNLRCSHCYQENYRSQDEMSIDSLKMIADKLISALNKWQREGRIALTGGEPLLKKELFPLLDYLQESEQIKNISILSNGTLLNKEIAEQLHSIKKLHFVQISLDGACAEINDVIRGKGSFHKALKAIRLLNQNGIPVRLMFTIHKGNVNEISPLIDLAISEDIDGLTFERFVPCGNGKGMKDMILSPGELRDAYQRISERADLEYDRGSKLTILKLRTLFACIDKNGTRDGSNIPFKKQLGAMCSVGIDSLCFLPDGSVLPFLDSHLFNDTLDWLISQQNEDYGWGYCQRQPVGSTPFCTGVAITGLLQYPDKVAPEVIANGLKWIEENQLEEGLWPDHYIEEGSVWAFYALTEGYKFLKGQR